MMPSRQAEAGQAGSLDGLARAVNLKALGVHGDGAIGIDDGGAVPGIEWRPTRFPGESSVRATACRKARAGPGIIDFEKESCKTRTDFESLYRSRIEYLRHEAMQDGHVLNKDSEMDFQRFVLSVSGIRRGGLVLTDGGNLRAVWKDEQGTRLGLQFLGGETVQYVVFRRRGAERRISRVAGRDSLEGVLRQIDAFDLGALPYA